MSAIDAVRATSTGAVDSEMSRAMLGASAEMAEVSRLIDRVSATDAGVLITGESGSGKEVVAQRIHAASARAGRPFVAINCGAIPDGLIEAELFGYEKGGVTGASRAQAGVFERAQHGTLLLDEITEMPLEMQTRLLRVLETRKLYRLGGLTEIPIDVRVIAATNRCPLEAVQKGRLREDVLYRLAVFPISVPALRDRGEDVLSLADHFLDSLNSRAGSKKRFSAESLVMLKQHSWPGNVRELKNCIERAFILGDGTLELAPLLSPEKRNASAGSSTGDEPTGAGRLEIRVGSRIDDVERSLIEATLEHFRGNKRRAADTLGCSLKTLYNKLHVYSQSQEFANT